MITASTENKALAPESGKLPGAQIGDGGFGRDGETYSPTGSTDNVIANGYHLYVDGEQVL